MTDAVVRRPAQNTSASPMAAALRLVLVIITISPRGAPSAGLGVTPVDWERFAQTSPAIETPHQPYPGPASTPRAVGDLCTHSHDCLWPAVCSVPATTPFCWARKQQVINFWKVSKSQGILHGGSKRLAKVGIPKEHPPTTTTPRSLSERVKGARRSQGSQLASPLLPQITQQAVPPN